jgi:hypothetical protein
MRSLIVTSLLMATVPVSAADCGSPTQWAEAFYTKHYHFYSADPDELKPIVTPQFHQLLETYYKKTVGSGELGFDYDPWLGAQDGEIGRPIAFSLESQIDFGIDPTAVVSMSYRFDIGQERPTTAHSVHLVLVKTKDSCWHLHDFMTPLGESLSYLYARR